LTSEADEVPRIKVRVAMSENCLLVEPIDDNGAEVLQQVIDGMPDTQEWHFNGATYLTPRTKDLLVGVRYWCGGEMRRQQEGNVTRTVYDGAVRVYFDLTEVEDQKSRYSMLYYGYFAGVSMDADSTAHQLQLRPAKVCKICHGQLSRFMELEWKVCDTCATICNHDYVEGVGQAGGHIAYLPFCQKCGRGDPNWKPSEDPREDMLKTVSEGGLHMLVLAHPDGSSTVITKK
jgi:hypothetical protein